MAHVDGGLLLAGKALHEVVVAGALDGDRPAGGMLERIEIVQGLVADAVLFQIAGGVGVFRVDEGAGLGALGVFKPAIVVGDLRAEIVVDDRIRFGGGRRGERNAIAAMDGLGKRVSTE